MTRREEVELAWFKKEVQSNHRYDEKSFKEAVEWADKTMIEKACEWLIHNVNRYINDEGAGYFRIEKTLFDHFRKAMEE